MSMKIKSKSTEKTMIFCIPEMHIHSKSIPGNYISNTLIYSLYLLSFICISKIIPTVFSCHFNISQVRKSWTNRRTDIWHEYYGFSSSLPISVQFNMHYTQTRNISIRNHIFAFFASKTHPKIYTHRLFLVNVLHNHTFFPHCLHIRYVSMNQLCFCFFSLCFLCSLKFSIA